MADADEEAQVLEDAPEVLREDERTKSSGRDETVLLAQLWLWYKSRAAPPFRPVCAGLYRPCTDSGLVRCKLNQS